MRKPWSAAALAAVVLAVAACASSSSTSSSPPAAATAAASSSASSPAASMVLFRTIQGRSVLTNSNGFTLYWFSADTSTTSKCTGSCASYWPPVPGPLTAGPGVTGTLGTITRPDGTIQATYDGHPLYTYVGDSAPGQNKGNGINDPGGIWHEMTVTGRIVAPAAAVSVVPASSPPAVPASSPAPAPVTPTATPKPTHAPAPAPSTSAPGGGYGY